MIHGPVSESRQKRGGGESASCMDWMAWCQASPNWTTSSYPSSEGSDPQPLDPDGTWTSLGEETTDVVEIVVDDVVILDKMWM